MSGPSARAARAVAWAAACLVATAAESATAGTGPAPVSPDHRLPSAPFAIGPHETTACLPCHGLPGFFVADSTGRRMRLLTVDPGTIRASAHGRVACGDCHPEIVKYPHELGSARPRVACDAGCHARDETGADYRHTRQAGEFRESVHRGGLSGEQPASPGCADCHGGGDPHAVTSKPAGWNRAAHVERCAPCHDDAPVMRAAEVEPAAVASWRESFHARAIRFGSERAATCQHCHGVHLVRAPEDTASTVHPSHLAATCGQQDCHAGARMRFAMSGASHLALRVRRDPALAAAAFGFGVVGSAIVLVLAAAVALDALRRARVRAQTMPLDRRLVARLSLAQRLQHLALVIAFTVLAVTGLPLRFPGAEPLAGIYRLLGGLEAARDAHRFAGALLAAAGLAHLVYALVLLVRARFDVRRAWPMLPAREDLHDARELLRYQLGRRTDPPTFDRHPFRSKIHYFAVLWGLPVMVASGLVLGFPVALGNRLPDAAIGIAFLAHRDEALAAIAIVACWHLYLVHVAPWPHHRFRTWFDGRITRGRWLAEHGREAARAGEKP